MKCSVCGKYVQYPERFYSTGPLIQRGFCCDECYRIWVLPYRERLEVKMPASLVWTSRGEEYLREE